MDGPFLIRLVLVFSGEEPPEKKISDKDTLKSLV